MEDLLLAGLEGGPDPRGARAPLGPAPSVMLREWAAPGGAGAPQGPAPTRGIEERALPYRPLSTTATGRGDGAIEWTPLCTEDLLASLSVAPVAPTSTVRASAGGCVPDRGPTHIYLGVAGSVTMVGGEGGGEGRGSGTGSGSPGRDGPATDAEDVGDVEPGTVQGVALGSSAYAGQALLTMQRRVEDYVAGRPLPLRLRTQPVVPCPHCGSGMGVPGSFTNPLDFRYRCARCAWVWCSWEVPSSDTAWMQLLWGRCLDWAGRRWLLVLHEDNVVGVVPLDLALALRELVSSGAQEARSEVGVMWTIVAWTRHWLGVDLSAPDGKDPWCVEPDLDKPANFRVSRWLGPAQPRPRDVGWEPGVGDAPDEPMTHDGDGGGVSEWEHALDNGVLGATEDEHDVLSWGECKRGHAGTPWRHPRGDSLHRACDQDLTTGSGVSRGGSREHDPGGGAQLCPRECRDVDVAVGECDSGPLGEGAHCNALGTADLLSRPTLGVVRGDGGVSEVAMPTHSCRPPTGDPPTQPGGGKRPTEASAVAGSDVGGGSLPAHGAGEPREGAWWGRRSRSERRRQQQEVVDLPSRVVTLVRDQVATWSVSQVWETSSRALVDWSPWPTGWSFPGPVWDLTVEPFAAERASVSVPWSPGTPVATDSARVPASCTLRPEAIWRHLEGHPHRGLMAGGARWGFPLLARCPLQHTVHESGPLRGPAVQELVDTWFDNQLAEGKSVCVDDVLSRMPALIVTPIVVAPKAGSVGRVCHDLSAGGTASVNASMDTAPVEPLILLQPGDIITRARYLAETRPGDPIVAYRLDLKAYFSQLGWRVRDAWLTGQRHRGRTVVHRFATFGGSSVPGMASLVTNTVCDIMARRGFWVRVFLDDYVGVTTQSRVDEEVAQLRKLLAEFGLRENQSKFVAPAQDVDILGIRFQFGASVAGVAVGRSATLEATLQSMLLLRTVGGPELRKLAGVLAFVSAVVPWGRSHVSPLWTAISGLRGARHYVNINGDRRRCLQWWLQYLRGQLFTVTPFDVGLSPDRPLLVIMGLRSDASTRWGMGAVSGAHGLFLRTQWTPAELLLGIAVLEGMALLFLLVCVGHLLSGSLAVLQSDNAAIVFGLLREHSRDPRVCAILQAVVGVQELWRFKVVLGHTSTVDMGGPDGLSHGDPPSQCLLYRPGGWSECVIPTRVRALSTTGSEPLLQQENREHVVAAREWVSSISGLLHTLGASAESCRLCPVPFIPFRLWEVVLNEPVLNPSHL